MTSAGQHAKSVDTQRFFHLLNDRITQLKNTLIGVNVADLMWAYARNGLECQKAMETCVEVVKVRPEGFRPAELETTKWALEQLGFTAWDEVPALKDVEAIEHRPDTVEAQLERTYTQSGLAHWSLPYRFYDTLDTNWEHFRFILTFHKIMSGTYNKRASVRRKWKQTIKKFK